MENKQQTPSWDRIFVGFIVSIAAFYTVYRIFDMIFFELIVPITPDWLTYPALIGYLIVLCLIIWGTLKLYTYVSNKKPISQDSDEEEN